MIRGGADREGREGWCAEQRSVFVHIRVEPGKIPDWYAAGCVVQNVGYLVQAAEFLIPQNRAIDCGDRFDGERRELIAKPRFTPPMSSKRINVPMSFKKCSSILNTIKSLSVWPRTAVEVSIDFGRTLKLPGETGAANFLLL